MTIPVSGSTVRASSSTPSLGATRFRSAIPATHEVLDLKGREHSLGLVSEVAVDTLNQFRQRRHRTPRVVTGVTRRPRPYRTPGCRTYGAGWPCRPVARQVVRRAHRWGAVERDERVAHHALPAHDRTLCERVSVVATASDAVCLNGLPVTADVRLGTEDHDLGGARVDPVRLHEADAPEGADLAVEECLRIGVLRRVGPAQLADLRHQEGTRPQG